MSSSFTLREMLPSDSQAIIELGEESPDTGRVSIHSAFVHDPYETLMAVHPSSIGVVVEVPDHEGIVGNGLVRFSEGQFEGQLRKTAYLSSLHVHPNYRRRGIASAIAEWRLQKARERIGADGVIFAGIQASNEGSVLTAKKWMTQNFLRAQSALVKMHTRSPPPLAGIEVRPARSEDYEQIVEKQNRFYRDYNLYQPLSAEALAGWVNDQRLGKAIKRYYLAQDAQGNIRAGMATIAIGQLIEWQVRRMPTLLQLTNLFLNFVPRDNVIRRILGLHFWFEEEHPDAGHYLWEMVRWLGRDQGTSMVMFFDSAGPVLQTIPFPRYGLQPPGTIALQAPVQMPESHLMDMYAFTW